MKIGRLSILGLGLMGGSVALAARRDIRYCEIIGYDIDRRACQIAVKSGVVDQIARSVRQAVTGADLVVIAVPIAPARKILSKIARYVPERGVVTDVCSTKRSITDAAGKLPNLSRQFVGSHPMAGSAHKGIAHADPGIFQKSLCILTTRRTNAPAAVRLVEHFWRKLGMQTTRMPADRHDALVALASHLPQLAVSALMAVQTPQSLAVAGRGLIDTTRLAGSDGELWAGILIDNADAVLAGIDRFGQTLAQLRRAIHRRDRTAIIRVFRAAQGARRALE